MQLCSPILYTRGTPDLSSYKKSKINNLLQPLTYNTLNKIIMFIFGWSNDEKTAYLSSIHLQFVTDRCRASVAEWLRSSTSNHLPSHRCGFKSRQWLWILSCEEAIKLPYGMLVGLLGCLFVPEIMHIGKTRRLPPSVKLESRNIHL